MVNADAPDEAFVKNTQQALETQQKINELQPTKEGFKKAEEFAQTIKDFQYTPQQVMDGLGKQALEQIKNKNKFNEFKGGLE